MVRRAFEYRGCCVSPERLPKSILIACNRVNRYLKLVWRIVFPDDTWARTGTKQAAVQYINTVGRLHGVKEKSC